MKRHFLICILIISGALRVNAQDPFYSQFYNSPQVVNPALTGINFGTVQITGQFKNYLAGVDPFNTYSLTVDMSLMEKNMSNFAGAGLSVMNSSSGPGQNILQVSGMGSYHIDFGNKQKSFLSVGLQGGLYQMNLDFSQLTTQSQWDPSAGFDPSLSNGEPNIEDKTSAFDVSAGLLYYSLPKPDVYWFVGGAVYHINQPVVSLTGSESALSRRITATAGARLGVGNRVYVVPNMLYMIQGDLDMFQAGGSVEYDFNRAFLLSLGGWIRNLDGLVVALGTEFNQLRLGVSYDLVMSDLKNATSNGGIEISLSYAISKKIPVKNKILSNPTPEF